MNDGAGALITLRDVSVVLGPPGGPGLRALDGVSLQVQSDARVGLMGASGSGKSTLLHVLCDLLQPQEGDVTRHVEGLPGLVFQFPENQLFSETVAADVGYGLREGGVDADAVQQRVDNALGDVGLDPETFRDRVPFHLSGGERRRVALAGVLAQQRPLLFLDEPTLALDAEGVRHLQSVLARRHQAGQAFWIASHDADFLATTCTHLVVLGEGRVLYDGPADAYWADPAQAAAHGVRPPRVAQLSADLRARGVSDLPPHPSENQLVAALQRLLETSS